MDIDRLPLSTQRFDKFKRYGSSNFLDQPCWLSSRWGPRQTMNCTKSLGCSAVAVAVLTVIPALYSGPRFARWGSSDELRLAASTLDALPQRIGAWTCDSSAPLADDAREVLKYEASLSHAYLNQDKSAKVQCILIVGLPGPIVRHPPEFCYTVRDNVLLDQRVVTFNSGNVEHAVRLTRFQEPRALKHEFFVATGWFANGHLSTSDFPRMTYGAEPFVYAIQIVWPITGDRKECEAVGISFLKDLMPAFREHCVMPSENRGKS
jgi:hypothetical protein